MSELLCLLNAVIGALCMSACKKKKKKSLSRVCTRDRALSDLKKRKRGLGLIFCTVSHLHAGESHAHMLTRHMAQ